MNVWVDPARAAAAAERPLAFHRPHLPARAASFVADAVSRGRLRFGGEYSERSTAELRRWFAGTPVELTGSCTAALEAAALALDLGPGDEVIVPTYTFCATATAFARTGARIVLCDVDPATLMMTSETVARCVSSRTRAVVPVHYGGFAAPVGEIRKALAQRRITIVEDAAQGFGASVAGRPLGVSGQMAAFSFHDTKIIGSGHGGALVVADAPRAVQARLRAVLDRGTNFARFAAGRTSHYEWTATGGSFRPTEIQCAVLAAQLAEAERTLARHRTLRGHYFRLLSRGGVSIVAGGPDTISNGYAMVLALSAQGAGALIARGRQAGVEIVSHYKPLHLSAMGRGLGYRPGDLPAARRLWGGIVRLPLHTGLDDRDVERVCRLVLEA